MTESEMRQWGQKDFSQNYLDIADIFINEKFEIMRAGYLEAEHYARIDTLQDQMDEMKQAGFKEVECFYKQGMFAMYGGRRVN